MSTKPGRWVPPLSSLLSIGTLVSLYSSTMRCLDRAGMQWVLSNTEEAEVQTHYLSLVVCVKSYLQFLNMGEGREGNLSMEFEMIGDVHISHSFFLKTYLSPSFSIPSTFNLHICGCLCICTYPHICRCMCTCAHCVQRPENNLGHHSSVTHILGDGKPESHQVG